MSPKSSKLHTALCTELKPNFVLRTARSAVLNTKFVPDALAKCCMFPIDERCDTRQFLKELFKSGQNVVFRYTS
jgi:hypothetical protein